MGADKEDSWYDLFVLWSLSPSDLLTATVY